MSTARTALITGGNRGIGLETARQLAKLHGFHVIIGSRSLDKAKEAAEKLQKEGLSASAVEIDVSSDASVEAAVAAVSSKVQHLDVLVNNAGVLLARGDLNPKLDLTIMKDTFDVNVVGTIRVTNGFLDLVKAAPEGRIVNVSSYMGSLTLHPTDINTCAYSLSKTALNMYTVSLAKALKDTNVKVNSGHPGWVKTDMGGDGAELTVEEGAETSVYLATLPSDGPTGGFFYKKDVLPW